MIGNISKIHWEQLNDEITRCELCPRLVEWRQKVSMTKKKAFINQDYWGRPVPGFGDLNARVMIIGLAPGAHGSNRTGRMFTGDSSGSFLYPALFRSGFANKEMSENINDGLVLKGLFITALCRCVPPGNFPKTEEIRNCLPFLKREIELLPKISGFVSLGNVAFQNLLKIYKEIYKIPFPPDKKFIHGKLIRFKGITPWIIASYHPSRQNTQTGKLTREMFDNIWSLVNQNLLM